MDKMGANGLVLEGKWVRLEEIQPKYFKYVVEWRNNPELNKYIVQPFVLTEELEAKWYEKYLKEDNHGMMILIAKDTDTPFGTLGWIDYNREEKWLIPTHAIVGDERYHGSKEQIEANLLLYDYYYDVLGCLCTYCHVSKENRKVVSFNKRFGFISHGEVKFPECLQMEKMVLDEYIQCKDGYLSSKNKILRILDDI